MVETLIEKAKEFAKEKHAGHTYGSGDFFENHLTQVAELVEGFLGTVHQEGIAMAYLHDVIEDTDTSYEDLKEMFGEYVAQGVKLLTDPAEGTRSERKKAVNLAFSTTNRPELFMAVLVKVCDRIANQAKSIHDNDIRRMKMYSEEFPDFMLNIGNRSLPWWGVKPWRVLLNQYGIMNNRIGEEIKV